MKDRKSLTTAPGRLFVCLVLVEFFMWSSSAFTQNNTIFGPNIYVFTPSNSVSSINSTLATLAGNSQFSKNRYAVFFEPGTYTGVESAVGFYESIAGLGQTPGAVRIDQGFLQSNQPINGNDTQNFWRSMENLEMHPWGEHSAMGRFAGSFHPAYAHQQPSRTDGFRLQLFERRIHCQHPNHRAGQLLLLAAVVYARQFPRELDGRQLEHGLFRRLRRP